MPEVKRGFRAKNLLDYYILARQRLKYSSAKGLNSKPGVVYLAFYLVRLGMSVVKHNC